MKLVINKCYGGFSLSPMAVKRLAELNGKHAFFFTGGIGGKPYSLVDPESIRGLFWSAFTSPTAPATNSDKWYEMTIEERQASNAAYSAVHLTDRPDDRSDPLLIQVVEELGEAAYGDCAKLAVVEIPDGTDYEIDEYDGMESVHEKHRSWN